ncbi:MAG: AMP-binding protein, partial [Acidobacteria bacterium]|nr:AMP-binding protein [Acidobacteriota bacterium]
MFKSAHTDTFARDNLPPTDKWPELTTPPNYPERLNASVSLLDQIVERVGRDKTALIATEGLVTYGQLLDQVNSISLYLESIGVQPGNRILLRGPNNASIVALWFAILRVGAIAVTTIHLQRTGELEKIVDIAKVQFAFVDHRFLDDWSAVKNYLGKTLSYGSKD